MTPDPPDWLDSTKRRHFGGYTLSRTEVGQLFDFVYELQQMVRGLADRCYGQSELLTRRARVCQRCQGRDESTGPG